jgi:CRISPR-associated exonuclease Cas4
MSIPFLLIVLTLAVVAYIVVGRWSIARRGRIGLDTGVVVSADDSLIRAPTLRSERLSLAGRCDHMLRVGNAFVPVEQKPSARHLYPSHVLQVGALCLLIEDVYQVRPPYGVVVLADGVREHVPFTEELENSVNAAMDEMRRILATGTPPGPRWIAARCRPCGYHPVCWDRGTPSVGDPNWPSV